MATIYAGPWLDHLPPRPKGSRTIAREREKADEAERLAAEAAKLRGMVHRSLRPPAGRLWSIHQDALLLIGPTGGIPISAAAALVLSPLAVGGRQPPRDEDRAHLLALAGRLAAVGLKIERRKKGLRVARMKPATVCEVFKA